MYERQLENDLPSPGPPTLLILVVSHLPDPSHPIHLMAIVSSIASPSDQPPSKLCHPLDGLVLRVV